MLLANSLAAEQSSPTEEAFDSTQQKVVEAERAKDVWTFDGVVNGIASASVNGQIIWGDRLRIRLNKDFCMEGNLVTSFYTYEDNTNFEQLLNKTIPIKLLGLDHDAEVVVAMPFLLGHSVWLDLGWFSLRYLIEEFKEKAGIRISLVNSEEINISDYFDISENVWSSDGIGEALDKAIQQCKELAGLLLEDGTYSDVWRSGTFVGAWKNAKPNGFGRLTKEGKFEYKGEVVDGVPNGFGEIIYNDGEKWVGNFSNGSLEGEGSMYFSDGAFYKGQLEKNRFSGAGTYVDKFGDRYSGSGWKDGVLYGFGRVEYASGNYYEGQLRYSRHHGIGRFKTKNKIYEGIWKGNILETQTDVIIIDSYFDWPTDYTYEGEVLNNLANGEGTIKYPNGITRYKGEFKNGLRHGEGTEFIFKGHRDFDIFSTTNLYAWEENINWAAGLEKSFELIGRWEKGQFKEGQLLNPNGDILTITDYKNHYGIHSPEEIFGKLETPNGDYKGAWTVDRNLRSTTLSGARYEIKKNGTKFVGSVQNGKRHGMGVLKTPMSEVHLEDNEVYFGNFEYGYKSGKAFVINTKTKQVKYCTFIRPEWSEPAPKPRCISNSGLEWKVPIRELLSISTYLVPKLKLQFDKLSLQEKEEMGLKDWSFETFFQLLYSNYVLFDSIEINSKDAALRLFEKLKDQETVRVQNTHFFDSLLN